MRQITAASSCRLTVEIGGLAIAFSAAKKINARRRRWLRRGFVVDAPATVQIEEKIGFLDAGRLGLASPLVRTRFWQVYRSAQCYYFFLKKTRQHGPVSASFNLALSKGCVYYDGKKDWLKSRLSGILIMSILALRKKFLFHACGISCDGKGYLFIGRSGKGKSTLARFWKRAGALVLDDDRIAVYKEGRRYLMGAGRFSGKASGFWLPRRAVRLDKIFFIGHGKNNLLRRKNPAQAFVDIVKDPPAAMWHAGIIRNMFGFIKGLVRDIGAFDLKFTLDARITSWLRQQGEIVERGHLGP